MHYRLLHTADVHLDRSFAGIGCHGDLARRRRQGLRDALARAGETAVAAGCSALTIGGDLYEHERAGLDTERFLVETFAALRPLRVFIAPGNHDPLLPGSIHARADWPDNVHVFRSTSWEGVELAPGLALWGVAHRSPAWTEDPLAAAAVPGSGVHLALFHGSELGWRSEGKAPHGPFRLDELRRAGFAAGLCGHYHRRRTDPASGLVYPGTPEPLAFDETGARGPVLVDVDEAGSVSFTPVQSNRWWAAAGTAGIEGCRSSAGVLERAAEACEVALEGLDPDGVMLHLDLTGVADPGLTVEAAAVECWLRDRRVCAHVRVRDLTRPGHDMATIAGERSTRGAFVRAVEAAQRDAAGASEQALLDEALRYGLAALSGAEVALA